MISYHCTSAFTASSAQSVSLEQATENRYQQNARQTNEQKKQQEQQDADDAVVEADRAQQLPSGFEQKKNLFRRALEWPSKMKKRQQCRRRVKVSTQEQKLGEVVQAKEGLVHLELDGLCGEKCQHCIDKLEERKRTVKKAHRAATVNVEALDSSASAPIPVPATAYHRPTPFRHSPTSSIDSSSTASSALATPSTSVASPSATSYITASDLARLKGFGIRDSIVSVSSDSAVALAL